MGVGRGGYHRGSKDGSDGGNEVSGVSVIDSWSVLRPTGLGRVFRVTGTYSPVTCLSVSGVRGRPVRSGDCTGADTEAPGTYLAQTDPSAAPDRPRRGPCVSCHDPVATSRRGPSVFGGWGRAGGDPVPWSWIVVQSGVCGPRQATRSPEVDVVRRWSFRRSFFCQGRTVEVVRVRRGPRRTQSHVHVSGPERRSSLKSDTTRTPPTVTPRPPELGSGRGKVFTRRRGCRLVSRLGTPTRKVGVDRDYEGREGRWWTSLAPPEESDPGHGSRGP